jgi:hypothetical protein
MVGKLPDKDVEVISMEIVPVISNPAYVTDIDHISLAMTL